VIQELAKPERGKVGESKVVLHYYWPSEFPIALCGAISTVDRIRDEAPSGPVCEKCLAIKARVGTQRQNPHQESPRGPQS
jgi:hypothetical protein